MLGDLSGELFIIILLTLANGFFSGAEIAIVSARRSRLETLAAGGNNAAAKALQLAENPDRFLATVQIGITLIGTFSAAFGGARIGDILANALRQIDFLAPSAEAIALAIVITGLTYLSLVLGELVPKRLALRGAERLALVAAPIMVGLSTLAKPAVALLTTSVNAIFRLIGKESAEEQPVTEEDIVYLLREGTESGTVEAEQASIIHRIFQFNDRPLHTMMIPRTRIAAVHINTPIPQVIETFIKTGYSRLLVYEGSIDQTIGVLHVKDLFTPIARGSTPQNIHSLLHPIQFLVETTHGDDALLQLRQNDAHIAAVIDEYGQVTGLITMEDLLEELVGDIRDEYDQDERSAYHQQEDGSWLVDATETYGNVCQTLMGEHPQDETMQFSSLASIIIRHLGRIPHMGDTIVVGRFIIQVVDMDGRRIDKVLIKRQAPK